MIIEEPVLLFASIRRPARDCRLPRDSGWMFLTRTGLPLPARPSPLFFMTQNDVKESGPRALKSNNLPKWSSGFHGW